MGLIEQAKQDVRRITTDLSGFGVSLVFVKPDDSLTVTVTGMATSHFLNVDADGAAAIGKNATCTVCESVLNEAGFTTRNDKGEVTMKGCKVSWIDSTGTNRAYKISHHQPDNTLGLIVCFCRDFE